MSKYYFVIKLFVSNIGSQEVPLIESDSTVACGLDQVDFLLVVFELQHHRHMVEVALRVSPGQVARRRVRLK